MVRSPDRETDFFDIFTEVWLGDTLAPYLFIPWQDNVLQTSIDPIKKMISHFQKKKSKKQTISRRN